MAVQKRSMVPYLNQSNNQMPYRGICIFIGHDPADFSNYNAQHALLLIMLKELTPKIRYIPILRHLFKLFLISGLLYSRELLAKCVLFLKFGMRHHLLFSFYSGHFI